MRHFSLRISCLLMAVLIAFSVTSCSGNTQSDSASAGPQQLKIAMLMDGQANDGGWNQSAYDALMKIRDELGAEVAFTEDVKQNDQVSLMREYVNAGYNVIIGHGYTYVDSLTQVSQEFPEVTFLGVVTDVAGGNLNSVLFKYGELGYLVGIVAARCTQSKVVGYISAIDNPNIQREVVNIKAKVKELDPTIEVKEAYTGSFSDINKAYEAAIAMIDGGADILITSCDAGSLGVFQAAEERGVKTIGWVSDQTALSPDTILTCGITSVEDLLYATIEKLQEEGKLDGSIITLGIADGVQYIGPFSEFVPQEVQDEVLAAQEDIRTGKISVLDIEE